MTWLQKFDSILSMRVDVMMPVFNLEPKHRVTMLTREEWTRGSGTPPAVKGLFWFTDGSRTAKGTRTGVYGQSVRGRLSISVGKHATVFQTEVYVIFAYIHETEPWDRLEKYVSIRSDSQAALKALQAAETTSPLVRQCQKALNDISTRHTVGLYWVPGHAGVQGNEITDRLARDSSV
jgi:ribonuclease HI